MKQRDWMITATALLLATASAGAQESDRFTWSGELGERRSVYLNNINGAVRIEAGNGRTVTVEAVKRWRRGDPDDVRIEARTNQSGDVIICALWHERSSCDESGIHTDSDRRRGSYSTGDVSVDFVVRVPTNARVDASTINGDLSVTGVSGDIRARTTNGDVEALSSGGRVRAGTVNGSVNVRTTVSGDDDLDYETVNGSVTIEIPANAGADVDLRVVNGRISSDFPMTLEGDINPRRIRAQLGSGGPRLRASTVNGSIRIRRQ